MQLIPLSLALASVVFISLDTKGQSVSTSASDTSERIHQVEINLVGTTQNEGDSPFTLKDRMAFYKVRGVSIAVIHNYKIEWAKGYGWADESLRKPVTDQTLFQAASISKSLNAVGVLKLAQEKKLDLYVDINNYLNNPKQAANTRIDSYTLLNGSQLNWKFPYDSLSKGKKITIANLLSHTGGLSVHGFGGYERGTDIPNIVQILDGTPPANSAKIRSMYEPGLKSEYSGGGVTISQLIVMNTTHMAYEKYMYENVLEPMGMTSSTYSQFPPRDKRTLYAAAYDAEGKEISGKYHIYPEQAAAGLWTNPTDLAKYIIETQLALEGKSAKVLDQQWTKTRLTPNIDKRAALGVFIDGTDSIKYFGHGGANEGFRSQYYGSLKDGNGVVVMVNSDNGAIIPEIVNSVAKVYLFKGLYHSKVIKAVKFSANLLDSYTGKYEIKPDLFIMVSRNGERLYGQPTGQGKYLLLPVTENKFSLNYADTQIEFIKDDKGEVTKAVVYQNGPHDAKKVN
ncbi:MAG TPA: serine hydrolase [Mucilaginibacter sp.]|nr:serine hydrolase [Mucilaginibacter sp.]